MLLMKICSFIACLFVLIHLFLIFFIPKKLFHANLIYPIIFATLI